MQHQHCKRQVATQQIKTVVQNLDGLHLPQSRASLYHVGNGLKRKEIAKALTRSLRAAAHLLRTAGARLPTLTAALLFTEAAGAFFALRFLLSSAG